MNQNSIPNLKGERRTCQVLTRDAGPPLAYDAFLPNPDAPVILFLSGYRSDMNGSKATALSAWARATSRNFIRFDYTGHGESGGVFAEASLSDWVRDAESILDHVVPKGIPVILVGSSMGGWLALCLALRRPDRMRGLVGIAAAPDFTRLMYDTLSRKNRATLDQTGVLSLPSAHGPDPYLITRRLIEDGHDLSVLGQTHTLQLPMVLFHGQADPSVPQETPSRIARAFPLADVQITMIPNGDHGLSRADDLAQIYRAIEKMESELTSGDS